MAILKTPLPECVRGHVDKQIVIKHRFGKTIITAYPDMSRVCFNENQKAKQRLFADAVIYARSIVNDPVKKARYKAILPARKRVFNAAIADFMHGRDLGD
ncbi:hypothetical protein [Desertivirga brevis]|uniref:hypothetical protein n=1 Tax=Desertivirga brevis TaxID=2810310 RepID=UPI001A958ED4|nr:hypothetical protein [Pedobacter sp. SYSU D00873]